MDVAQEAELAHLRVRAYGRHADLDDEGLARLHALEAESRAETAREPVPASSRSEPTWLQVLGQPEPESDPAPTPEASATTAAAAEAGASGDDNAGEDRADRPAWYLPAVWGATVVAGAVIASTVTYGLVSLSPFRTDDGAALVTTLAPVEVDWPEGIQFSDPAGPDPLSFRFDDVVIQTYPVQMGYGGLVDLTTGTCMVGLSEASLDSENPWSDWSVSGCGAGRFSPSAAFIVDSTTPRGVRDRFPLGTSVQFVLKDDTLGVFTLPPETPTT